MSNAILQEYADEYAESQFVNNPPLSEIDMLGEARGSAFNYWTPSPVTQTVFFPDGHSEEIFTPTGKGIEGYSSNANTITSINGVSLGGLSLVDRVIGAAGQIFGNRQPYYPVVAPGPNPVSNAQPMRSSIAAPSGNAGYYQSVVGGLREYGLYIFIGIMVVFAIFAFTKRG